MGQVLAFNPSRARTYLHGLRGAAHRYAWRYYRFLQGKARRSPPRPRRLLTQTANIIRQAIKIGMGLERAAKPAPATFAGWQDLPPKLAARLGRKREPMFQLTAGIPGHPERSHVSGETLTKAGFTLPEIPEDNGLIWTGGGGRNPRAGVQHKRVRRVRRRRKATSNPQRGARASGGARLIYPSG